MLQPLIHSDQIFLRELLILAFFLIETLWSDVISIVGSQNHFLMSSSPKHDTSRLLSDDCIIHPLYFLDRWLYSTQGCYDETTISLGSCSKMQATKFSYLNLVAVDNILTQCMIVHPCLLAVVKGNPLNFSYLNLMAVENILNQCMCVRMYALAHARRVLWFWIFMSTYIFGFEIQICGLAVISTFEVLYCRCNLFSPKWILHFSIYR